MPSKDISAPNIRPCGSRPKRWNSQESSSSTVTPSRLPTITTDVATMIVFICIPLPSGSIPETLLKAWIGHANGNDIIARYDKSADDKEWRQTWANKCGIGFDLPEIGAVGSSPSKALQPGAVPKVSEAPQPQPTYIAEDSDLDHFFYSAPEEAA